MQYKLLGFGIDSAPMTTDYGIDLLAFDPKTHKAVSIQVRASSHHGDMASQWVEWNMPKQCVAQYVAVADIEQDKVWLFTKDTFEKVASSTGGKGRRLWWYVPESGYQSSQLNKNEDPFKEYEMASVIPSLFK